jgi:hypothetical protein
MDNISMLAVVVVNNTETACNVTLEKPHLLEHQIVSYLETRFTQNLIAPDVDLRMIGRLMRSKNYTQEKLTSACDEIQKIANQNNAGIVTKKHVSMIVYNKQKTLDSYLYFCWASQYCTAIHEAGHAVAIMYLLQDSRLLYEVSLGCSMRDSNSLSEGFVAEIPLHATPTASYIVNYWIRHQKLIDFFHKQIIVKLSGHVAEQVFGVCEYTWLYDLCDYKHWLSGRPRSIGFEGLQQAYSCRSDLDGACQLAQFLIDRNFVKKSQVQIVKEQYYQTYQFLVEHKDQILVLANYLMQHPYEPIYYDKVYDLLGLKRPLVDFEKIEIERKKKKIKK